MDSMVEILAIIPARGGSKGIPRKNIKPLAGYPLIAYSIAAGLRSRSVTRTIVSTDDPEIAEIARAQGADVPFMRPADLAADDTQDLPVFQHALSWLEEAEGYHPELVVQLRPTSPFRPPDLIDRAVKILLDDPQATSVRGVVPSKQNPYKMWKVPSGAKMVPLLDEGLLEPYNMPRQSLPATFWQTGHIDVIRTEVIQAGSMSGDAIYACQVDPVFSVDLDNLLDWERAEASLPSLQENIVLPGPQPLEFPSAVALLVLDFDGVMTDDRVYLNQRGEEMVAAHRGDGLGISLLKEAGVEVIVLSREKNPVVKARADKLGIAAYQGVEDKGTRLEGILADRNLLPEHAVYLGNDVNDLPCKDQVGLFAAVADAHPEVISRAGLVLEKKGGFGAVREMCDLILKHNSKAG
jgi:YrbI family 3-deoxy-D-manno-octulosonate 8-phosphate phosphatase